jgi:xylulokinase
MADVIGREIVTVKHPQDIGTVGTALVCGVGLGKITSFEAAKTMIPMSERFAPSPTHRAVYDRSYKVFKSLYQQNRKSFQILNRT